MFSAVRFTLLVAALSTSVLSQTPSTDGDRPDALSLLHQVGEKYAQAKYYHVEAVEESEYKGELFRNWTKKYSVAATAPDNLHHFEGRSQMGWVVNVSDGKTEWNYQPRLQEYIQHPADDSEPGRPKGVMPVWQVGASEAKNMLQALSEATDVLDPVYLPDASVERGDHYISCYVVRGRAKPERGTRKVDSQITFWIDKRSLTILRKHVHSEGALVVNDPTAQMVEDHTTLYQVVELDSPSLPSPLFRFEPPAGARLVEEFSHPLDGPAVSLIGKTAPPTNLKTADGKTVSLASFQGKPVLLDFWATWCVPCVSSLPDLEKLFRETADKGLVLLSIDEDEDAKTAADFWVKHAVLWPDFHDDGEIARKFLQSGIPQFVLIDASGKVAFVATSFEGERVRAAIAKLGPAFASLAAKKPQQ